jgi:hypothetical protein
MIDSLYKAFRKLILPKYPWIEDIVWTSKYHGGGQQYFRLEVYPYKEWIKNSSYSETETALYELEQESMTLFRMIRHEPNQFFDGAIFGE